ncbi:PREDICTED: uncharacterized protein LOC109342724, partial [Lupinus angustifolius]|uniref:uncharacterized protein LOC109342724 n=1 Tax=Lupinus angustifolius TaxID=3871 RepID=UPI00092F5C96
LNVHRTIVLKFSTTVKHAKKKKEFLLQLPTPSTHKVETSRFCDLHFDRLQPSNQEFDQQNKIEFGQFVARQALLDEEYWTAAWIRAESFWEYGPYERYTDQNKREFADQEYRAIKRRYSKVRNRENYSCIITVRKEQKNVKCSILKSVLGTLDLSTRYLLQGETFPGERENAPPFCSINRTSSSRYGYIANLCVTKSARRHGIASNMLHFAVESAKSFGVTRLYVHVDRNNEPAQILYKKIGFEMVEMANSLLLDGQKCLLYLQLKM